MGTKWAPLIADLSPHVTEFLLGPAKPKQENVRKIER